MERKFVGIVGLLVAIALLVAGFCIAVPDKYIPSWKDLDEGGMEEYVGGDAYNFIIEAGLRGGEIAGATISKAVCFAASGIALILALYAFCGKAAEAQPPARLDAPGEYARVLAERTQQRSFDKSDEPQEDPRP